MKVIFFRSADEIATEWPHVLPIFQKLPETPEYCIDDIRERALVGHMHIGCVKDRDERVMLACAFEFIFYPRMLGLNIVALAGEQLDAVHAAFFDAFCQYAQQAGAKAIEARVGDGMARLLARYGFSKAFNQVRIEV